MLLKYHVRFSGYISGFFPESFRFEVTFIVDDTEAVAIDIATPAGGRARCETTEAQTLDIMAMFEIAQALQMRAGMPSDWHREEADQSTSARSSDVSLSSISSSAARASSDRPL